MKKFEITLYMEDGTGVHSHTLSICAKTRTVALLIALATFITNENITDITSKEV